MSVVSWVSPLKINRLTLYAPFNLCGYENDLLSTIFCLKPVFMKNIEF